MSTRPQTPLSGPPDSPPAVHRLSWRGPKGRRKLPLCSFHHLVQHTLFAALDRRLASRGQRIALVYWSGCGADVCTHSSQSLDSVWQCMVDMPWRYCQRVPTVDRRLGDGGRAQQDKQMELPGIPVFPRQESQHVHPDTVKKFMLLQTLPSKLTTPSTSLYPSRTATIDKRDRVLRSPLVPSSRTYGGRPSS